MLTKLITVFALSTALVVFAVYPSNADNSSSLISGNAHYSAANYESAHKSYTKHIEQHGVSAEALYNIGNTLYRSGELGESLIALRMAQDISPGDKDIVHNLAVVRREFGEKLNYPFAHSWQYELNLMNHFPINSLVICFALAYLLFWLCLLMASNAIHWLTCLGLAIVVFCSGSALFFTQSDYLGEKFIALELSPKLTPAVIVEADTVVYAGNATHFQKIKLLEAGTELYATEARAGWVKIEFPDNRFGWVEEDKIIVF